MARPATKPTWATDATLSGGDQAGLATRLEPSAGIKSQGIYMDRPLPARVLSWMFGTICDWLEYNDNRLLAAQAMNWPERGSVADASTLNADMGLAYAPGIGVGGGPLLVAQTIGGLAILTSEDGVTWTNRGIQASASTTNPCISYGLINGVAGLILNGNANPNLYYTSINGTAWSAVTSGGVANAVSVYAPSLGLWVFAGNSGAVATSPSGLTGTWTARSTPAAWQAGCGGVKRIVWNGSAFIALPLASYNKFLRSTDGITWVEITAYVSPSVWTGIAYSAYDSLWMVTTPGTGIVTSTDNGLTWSLSITAQAANDIAVIGPLWVIATSNGAFGGIIYSVDKGASWKTVAVGNHRTVTGGWKRIIAAADRFVVSHDTGSVSEFALSQRALL
jgi:hypothetical protein